MPLPSPESSTSGGDEIKSEIERLKKPGGLRQRQDSRHLRRAVRRGRRDVAGSVEKGRRLGRARDIISSPSLRASSFPTIRSTSLISSRRSKLTSLDLSNNKISDITAQKLTSLRTLHLDGNEIRTFSAASINSHHAHHQADGYSASPARGWPSFQTASYTATMQKEDVIEIKLGGKTFKNNVKDLTFPAATFMISRCCRPARSLKKLRPFG